MLQNRNNACYKQQLPFIGLFRQNEIKRNSPFSSFPTHVFYSDQYKPTKMQEIISNLPRTEFKHFLYVTSWSAVTNQPKFVSFVSL